MKVMTFNLRSDNKLDINNRWESRKDIVKDIINKYKCDIICVQECNDKMYNDLLKISSDYNIVGEGRTKKFFKERTCIFVSKKYKIKEHATYWLSKKYDKVGSSLFYSLFPRIFTTVLIEDDQKRNIRICNTHLDCFLNIARVVQLNLLMNKLEDLNIIGTPVILMGDFNAKPESSLIKNFTQLNYKCGKFKCVCDVKPDLYNEGTRVGFEKNKKGDYIDYIFVTDQVITKEVEIVKYNKDGKYPSDHYPVFADIDIK